MVELASLLNELVSFFVELFPCHYVSPLSLTETEALNIEANHIDSLVNEWLGNICKLADM